MLKKWKGTCEMLLFNLWNGFYLKTGGKKPFAGNKPPDGVHVYYNSILWVSKGHKSLLNHRSGLGFLSLFSVKRDGLFSFTHVC